MSDILINDTVIILMEPECLSEFKVVHISPLGAFIENNQMRLQIEVKHLRMVKRFYPEGKQ